METNSKYTAKDGSQWLIYPGYLGWSFSHEDYDGAPDGFDHRHGDVEKRAQVAPAIEALILDMELDAPNREGGE